MATTTLVSNRITQAIDDAEGLKSGLAGERSYSDLRDVSTTSTPTRCTGCIGGRQVLSALGTMLKYALIIGGIAALGMAVLPSITHAAGLQLPHSISLPVVGQYTLNPETIGLTFGAIGGVGGLIKGVRDQRKKVREEVVESRAEPVETPVAPAANKALAEAVVEGDNVSQVPIQRAPRPSNPESRSPATKETAEQRVARLKSQALAGTFAAGLEKLY